MIQALEKEIKDSFINLNKGKTRRARHSYFNIENTIPEDYEEYLLELDKNTQVIVGIRHLNLNPKNAFIDFKSTTEFSRQDLLDLYQSKLKPQFTKFQPNSIRYYSREKQPETTTRSVYLVQTAQKMKAMPPFEQESDITLTSPPDKAYFEWYTTGYKEYHERFPHLAPYVPVNTLGDMEQSRKEGLLRIAHYKGQRIGLISAIKDQFLGNDGIYFLEIFLDQAFKGKGLAKCLQRKYVDEVATREIIWGTIDFENKPSLKTALSTGRMAVHFEHFIAIPS